MQNVSNLKAPFLDPLSGTPLVGGRVSFVEPRNDNQTSFIHIYDKDGTELQNPQVLNDCGTFNIQPFVNDGIDYKMIVERPTGIDDPAWQLVYTMDSKSQKITAENAGAAVVDSITALRTVNPEVGACIVKGYYDADDCCPSRIFRWIQDPLTDNNGTHILSSIQEYFLEGTWVCEPSGFVDVRWFGINSQRGDASGDIYNALSRAYQSHPNIPIYFPACEFGYLLGSSINLKGVILDRGANLYPVNNTVTIGIEWLENRGGKFCAKVENDANSVRVLPLLKGLLKTSWLKGTVAEFLTSAVLANLTEVDFDVVTYGGSTDVSIEKKIIHNSQNKPSNVGTSNCILFDNNEGMLYIYQLRLGRFLIKLNQGDINFAIAAHPESSMLDVHSQGISTPKIQVSGSGSFGTGISVTGSSSFFGSIASNSSISGTIINASGYFTGLHKGTLEGNVKPTTPVVSMIGGNGSGMTGELTLAIGDGEVFFLCVHVSITKTTSSEAFVSRTIRVYNEENLRIVFSTTDAANGTGDFLVVGRRIGTSFFFDKTSLVLSSGRNVNILVHND